MDTMVEQMQDNGQKLKSNIQRFINLGYFEEAKEAISKYEAFFSEDIDLCTMKSIIFMVEQNWESAREVLEQGRSRDPFHPDILFNLGYLHEQLGDLQWAIDFYSDAYPLSADDQQEETKEAITRIKAEGYTAKSKLAFFVKQGMDSFINNIVRHASLEYRVQKIVVTETKQIDIGMKWADICWFEWCDELLIYGSKGSFAADKKIICRLHSYEAYSDYPANVQWKHVDKVIFVSDWVRRLAYSRFPLLRVAPSVVIPNGIDLNRFRFKERSKGFNIAYVGYINFKKGPMLLLHTFKAIYDRDNRYKLYIAGQFQEIRDKLYFEQMIVELGLTENVIFEGWQHNIDVWLEDKHYILCSSLNEGNPVGVMEAMSRGLKPLIHHFIGGAREQFGKYVWNTIEECVDMVLSEAYNPKEYRDYIQRNYSLELQLDKLSIVFSECEDGESLDGLLKHFEKNVDYIKNTEKLFDRLLDDGDEERFMQVLSEWFIRSTLDLTARMNYYYSNMYRRLRGYSRFTNVDTSPYEMMEREGERLTNDFVSSLHKDDQKDMGQTKKKVLIFMNGLDFNQSLNKFCYDLIGASTGSNYQYEMVSLLPKEEFTNSHSSLDQLNSARIPLFIPQSRLIEARVREIYEYIIESKPDIAIFPSFYFAPISVLILPLLRKRNIKIGRIVFQQEEPYFDAKIDFTVSYLPHHTSKNNFEAIWPINTQLIDEKRNIKEYLHLDQNSKVIVSMGRESYYKDPIFWNLVNRMIKQIDNAVFVVFGCHYESFIGLVPEIYIKEKKIIFCGFQSDATSYLSSCDIYLNTFPVGGGLTLIESYYAGLPLITYFEKINKQSLTVEDISFIIPELYYHQSENLFPKPGNPEALLELTKKLILDREFREQYESMRRIDQDELRFSCFVSKLETYFLQLPDGSHELEN
jgi:glycosyltransferase involved in cell wall biosynthesis